MGCGCKKNKVTPGLPSGSKNASVSQDQDQSYDVVDGEGAVVASTTNLVFARAEARRVGGTVVPSTTTSATSA